MSTRVTIVVPVYNEGDNIRQTLAELDAKVRVDTEVWLVYDRDDDTTVPPARELEGKTRLPFRLVRNKYGRGALNAIKTGLEEASSELVVVTMADLCDPPEVINDMVAAAEREQADIVCASRYMKGGKQHGGPKFKGFLSHTAGLLLCWFARLPTHDPTNSFKLYDQNLALTHGEPARQTEMLALNISNGFSAMNTRGMAQAKAVVFFLLVAVLGIAQLVATRKKEVQQ